MNKRLDGIWVYGVWITHTKMEASLAGWRFISFSFLFLSLFFFFFLVPGSFYRRYIGLHYYCHPYLLPITTT